MSAFFAKPCESDSPLTGWWGSYPGHQGLDYGWLNADPSRTKRIYAAYAGVVVSVYALGGNNQDWGNRIIIEHAPGVRTTYNHIRTGTITVRVGQTVPTGYFLGVMGSTGRAAGDHLHWELYIDGIRVDPQPYREGKPIPRVSEVTLQPNQRKVLASDVANRRVGKPYTDAPIGEPLAPEAIATFSAWTRGESVNGNDIWYRGYYDETGYFWSGGFEGGANTAGLPEVHFTAPIQPNQRVVGSASMRMRSGPWLSFEIVGEELPANELGNFIGWARGQKVTVGAIESDIWYQGISRRWVAAAGFTSQSTDGLPEVPAPQPDTKPEPPKPTPDPEVPLNLDYKSFTADTDLAKWVGSPNFDFGPRRPAGTPAVGITFHWFGANAKGYTSTLSEIDAYFGSTQGKPLKNGRGTGTSSTYGVGATGAISQYVKEEAYHHADGDAFANGNRIAIEIEAGPNKPMSEAAYSAVIKLAADVAKRNNMGKLVLGTDKNKSNALGHSSVVATQCPGSVDMQRIVDGANEINFPTPKPDPKPDPDPEKVTVDKAALRPMWEWLKGIFESK